MTNTLHEVQILEQLCSIGPLPPTTPVQSDSSSDFTNREEREVVDTTYSEVLAKWHSNDGRVLGWFTHSLDASLIVEIGNLLFIVDM